MTITTAVIEQLCLQEESHWPDAEWKQERIEWITQELEAGRYGNVEKDFRFIGADRVPAHDTLQLACEALKFHRLRLAGHGLHGALDRMFA